MSRKYPNSTNAAISRALSSLWKSIPQDMKQQYIDKEKKLRQEYKVAIAKWRTENQSESSSRDSPNNNSSTVDTPADASFSANLVQEEGLATEGTAATLAANNKARQSQAAAIVPLSMSADGGGDLEMDDEDKLLLDEIMDMDDSTYFDSSSESGSSDASLQDQFDSSIFDTSEVPSCPATSFPTEIPVAATNNTKRSPPHRKSSSTVDTSGLVEDVDEGLFDY